MGHSRSEKANSRERILDVAARKIRENGIDSISIAELMKAANLTHGGFYRHFASRDDLIFEAVQRAVSQSDGLFDRLPDEGAVKALAQRYLSTPHRDNPGGGCPVAGLAADVGRSDDKKVRAALADRIQQNFEGLAKLIGDSPGTETAAINAWSTMVGAMMLARVFRGTRRSDEILKAARLAVTELAASSAVGRKTQGEANQRPH